MSEVHRALLTRNRMFLMHKILAKKEEFWSRLQEKELLTSDEVEEIKVGAHSRHRTLGRITLVLVHGHLHVITHIRTTILIQAS